MNRTDTDTIDHSALWDRIEHSEQKMTGILKWFGGIALSIALTWFAHSSTASGEQVRTNQRTAEMLAELKTLVSGALDTTMQRDVQLGQRIDGVETRLEKHIEGVQSHARNNILNTPKQ